MWFRNREKERPRTVDEKLDRIIELLEQVIIGENDVKQTAVAVRDYRAVHED